MHVSGQSSAALSWAAWNQQQQWAVQSATLHSSVWSQAALSDPAVSAAVAANVAAADQISPTTAQYIMSQPVYMVGTAGDTTPNHQSPLPPSHRPLNPDASRQPVQIISPHTNSHQLMMNVIHENQADTSQVVRRKRGKEIRKLR